MDRLFFAFMSIGILCVMIGAGYTIVKLYQLVRTDAETREIKFPRIWGLLAVSANNGVGLLLYLWTRHNHPVINISEEQSFFIEQCKKKSYVGIIFLVIGALICIWSIVLLEP